MQCILYLIDLFKPNQMMAEPQAYSGFGLKYTQGKQKTRSL
jgi:hypothetical protein